MRKNSNVGGLECAMFNMSSLAARHHLKYQLQLPYKEASPCLTWLCVLTVSLSSMAQESVDTLCESSVPKCQAFSRHTNLRCASVSRTSSRSDEGGSQCRCLTVAD